MLFFWKGFFFFLQKITAGFSRSLLFFMISVGLLLAVLGCKMEKSYIRDGWQAIIEGAHSELALDRFQRAYIGGSRDVKLLNGLGHVLSQERVTVISAVQMFEQSYQKEPDPDIRWQILLLYLELGMYERGQNFFSAENLPLDIYYSLEVQMAQKGLECLQNPGLQMFRRLEQSEAGPFRDFFLIYCRHHSDSLDFQSLVKIQNIFEESGFSDVPDAFISAHDYSAADQDPEAKEPMSDQMFCELINYLLGRPDSGFVETFETLTTEEIALSEENIETTERLNGLPARLIEQRQACQERFRDIAAVQRNPHSPLSEEVLSHRGTIMFDRNRFEPVYVPRPPDPWAHLGPDSIVYDTDEDDSDLSDEFE